MLHPENVRHAVSIPRRRLLAAAGSLPLAALASRASAAVPHVGYLSTGLREQRDVFLVALKDGLREYGWVDGRTVVIDVRFVGPDAFRFPAVASELVKSGPAAIVSTCVPSTRAARDASSTVPVVMAIDTDPVEAKLVSSLAHPGGNVTGAYTLFEALIPKWLELVKAAVPSARAVALVSDPNNLSDAFHARQVGDAASAAGLDLLEVKVRSRPQLAPALRGIDRRRVGAAVVVTDALLTSEIATVVPIVADELRLPAIYGFTEFVEAGGLMSYGFSYREYYRRVARYLDAVLRGAKPAALPVEQPTSYELVVNQPAAKRLGLALPPAILVRADRVIG